jgi:hypothetical protein
MRFVLGEITKDVDRGTMMVDVNISGLPMVKEVPMVMREEHFLREMGGILDITAETSYTRISCMKRRDLF